MSVAESKSVERFTNRVENYRKFRPGYPPEVVAFLQNELGLNRNSIVADIGSGTGIFARLLLETGCTVFGVEPNQEMRAAGAEYLKDFDKFTSVDGTAENTGLLADSVDFVAAAQAFHWFDIERSEKEARRVLKTSGYLVLIWNNPRVDATAFMREYEQFKFDFGTDFAAVRNNSYQKSALEHYLKQNFGVKVFANRQEFDLAGLIGRALSSSYIPTEEHPRFAAMLAELERIFERNANNGTIEMLYDTQVFYRKF